MRSSRLLRSRSLALSKGADAGPRSCETKSYFPSDSELCEEGESSAEAASSFSRRAASFMSLASSSPRADFSAAFFAFAPAAALVARAAFNVSMRCLASANWESSSDPSSSDPPPS